MRVGKECGGDRFVYVPLVAPPPLPPPEARTDAHNIDFGESKQGESDKEKKETGG